MERLDNTQLHIVLAASLTGGNLQKAQAAEKILMEREQQAAQTQRKS